MSRPIVGKLHGELAKIPRHLFRSDALVAGQWTNLTGNTFEVKHPVNGETLVKVANCGVDETRHSIEVARQAQKSWSRITAKDRGVIIRRWGELMTENAEHLARLITAENGKPITESRGEVAYAASFCDWSAEEGRRTIGETIPSPFPDSRIVTLKQPIGVVGMITPWNFPAAMITRKAAPALAVGCSVVLKPAEDTPLTALALAQLAEEAGLPAGLLSVLPADRVEGQLIGAELCSNPSVSAISFTGSTQVGSILLRQSAETVKKVSLELGGLGPFIVFDSADLEAAASGLMLAKFRNTGQTCVCANNVMVQEGVHDEFVAIMEHKMGQLKFGDVFDSSTSVSCLINQNGKDKVVGQIANALEHGAKCRLGGQIVDGNHVEPTLLTAVAKEADIFNEETFGPVCAVYKFADEADAVNFANDANVGLAGYFFSRDHAQCWRVAEALEVGMVGVNTGAISAAEGPFGGVKRSGLGREGSTMGTEEFLETKYMCIGI